MSRYEARALALQVLYESDAAHREPMTVLHRHLDEGLYGDKVRDYSETVVSGVAARMSQLDDEIARYATEYPVDSLAAIDRNILRIAIFETRYGDVPKRASINEAVELAKLFGSETSPRFVNGVLAAVLSS
jgi:N utilization substance protein B